MTTRDAGLTKEQVEAAEVHAAGSSHCGEIKSKSAFSRDSTRFSAIMKPRSQRVPAALWIVPFSYAASDAGQAGMARPGGRECDGIGTGCEPSADASAAGHLRHVD
jgi:hypothetical protein